MNCDEIMTVSPVCCTTADSVIDAARAMQEHNVGLVPIVDDRKRISGVVTDRDIALHVVGKGLDPRSTLVESIMTRSPSCCGPDDSIEKALAMMSARQVRRIPIVTNGEVVGIVAQADIATRLVEPETTGAVVKAISEPTAGREH